jgi:putative flippase GtrA
MVFLFTALGYNATAAYITAAILGTPVTFIAMKIIVFQRKKTI